MKTEPITVCIKVSVRYKVIRSNQQYLLDYVILFLLIALFYLLLLFPYPVK